MATSWLAVFFFCSLLSGSHGVKSLRFFAIGDMGGIDTEPYSTYYERSTAAEMGKMADIYGPEFILELGDNFYYFGVKDVNDPRFNQTFESVYTSKSLQVPWYLIAGNHDHHGNASAQIEYSKRSKRWNFPNFYYYKEFTVGDVTVGLIFIDTILLCGPTDDFIVKQPQGPLNARDAEQQWQFIEKMLATSKANYLFTAGHYPIFSIAEHGPTHCLIDRLQPLLDKYGANGHLCGHDHNLQHLRVKSSRGKNLDYFVSGMANFIDPHTTHKKDVPPGSLLFHHADQLSKGGFLYAEAMPQNMTLTYIAARGNMLYTTSVSPRN